MLLTLAQEFMESPGTMKEKEVKVLHFHFAFALAIGGNSMANVDKSYSKILDYVKRHFSQYSHLEIYFSFKTFNLRSLRYLFKLFKKLNEYQKNGKTIQVFWSFVENKEMINAGLELKTFCEFPFEIIGIGGFPSTYWLEAS